MAVRKLSMREIQALIANKPLALVNLEHSAHNKKIVVKALNHLWKDPRGQKTFKVLGEFLKNVAPKYQLDANQDGVRRFLLREMSRISQPAPAPTGSAKERKGFLAGVAGVFKFASS